MRTLFLGGTERGFRTVKALLESGAHVVGIISLRQDEHETARYEEEIARLAADHGVAHYETKWMKDRDYAQIISTELKPDLVFVVGCRILLPSSIYGIPPSGTLAVHDSLLPEYRGFAPLNWAILNGETRAGVTLFYLSEAMDAGDIVSQKTVVIEDEQTAPAIYESICQATVEVVLEAHRLIESGQVKAYQQDSAKATYTCSRVPADGLIDWTATTRSIHNQVRALTYPYPGAFTFLKGRKVFVWKARPVAEAPSYVGRIPGAVVAIARAEGHVDVLTGDGVLRIQEVQLEGEQRVEAVKVITSIRARLGVSYEDLWRRLEALEQEHALLKEQLQERAS